MKKNTFQRIFLYWIPVLAWAALIFYLSDVSSLKAGLSTPNEILLRKVVHMTEFGILALLFFALLTRGYGWGYPQAFLVALLLTIGYAITDEVHQFFVTGRNGNYKDVFVDFLGGFIFLNLYSIYYFRKATFKTAVSLFLAIAFFLMLVISLIRDSTHERQAAIIEPKVSLEELHNEEALRLPEEKEQEIFEEKEPQIEVVSQESEPTITLPKKVLIDVPFSSQAPFGIWDDVHEEACEEMSLIMVKYFLAKEKLTPQTAENEIQELKEYQEKNYGHYVDSTMEEVVQIAEDFYGIKNMKVIYDFEIDELKEQLAKGNPVIVPTAGRRLGNPNFTQPGPLYHNLVVIGYDGETMITNDPGTRKGKQYRYHQDTLFFAIHDFEGNKKKIESGPKAMIVLEE